MSNRTMGTKFERDFCQILYEKGFWVHNLAQNSSGQPADIIAVRDGQTYLIDCKVCSKSQFSLSRIEENQHLAMKHFQATGNGVGWFALEVNGEIYMLDYECISRLIKRKTVLNLDDMRRYGLEVSIWMEHF